MRIAADRIKNRLNPTNSPAKSVVPAAAASPCALTGANAKPNARRSTAAISALVNRSSAASKSSIRPPSGPFNKRLVLDP